MAPRSSPTIAVPRDLSDMERSARAAAALSRLLADVAQPVGVDDRPNRGDPAVLGDVEREDLAQLAGGVGPQDAGSGDASKRGRSWSTCLRALPAANLIEHLERFGRRDHVHVG